MRILLLLCLLPMTLPAQSATRRVDVALLRRDLSRLADDSMRGRNTPSPELDRAAAYVAGEFRAAGLKPAGDRGRFTQRYPIADAVVDPGATVILPGGRRLQQGRDFLLYYDHNAPSRVTAPLVVLSGDLEDSSAAKLDLQGSILLLVPGSTPQGGLPTTMGRMLGNVMGSNPYGILIAAELGDSAAGEIRGDQTAVNRRLDLDPAVMSGGQRYSHAILVVPPATLSSALAGLGVHLPPASHPGDTLVVLRPPKATVTIETPHRNVARFTAANVVGMVEGSDPKLRGEYVVLSAHLDHLGVGKPDAKGDSIYNGADDNAAGSTALLALARALSRGEVRPKRSMLLVATSGEEQGMWGSDYFASHPPVPFHRIVADINIDGIGRPARTDSLAIVGGDSTDLGRIIRDIAASRPDLRLAAGDFVPEFYRRSDNINFARRGVPSVSLFSGGLLPYYHTPADQLEVIDFDWVRRVTELALEVSLAVANRPERPQWLRKDA
jgi:Peptidase family M28